MKNTSRILIAFLAFIAPIHALAQNQASDTPSQKALFRFNFNRDIGNWTSFGSGSATCITTEPELVKEGRGALKFKYEIGKGFQAILLTTFAEGRVANVKTFRFWVRPDHNTTLSFVLSEKDGGRYSAAFYAVKDTWNQVELSPGDFALDEGKDAPKDTDRVLDMELVNSIAMIDVNQTYPQSDAISKMFPVKIGSHMLLLDDLGFFDSYLPSTSSVKNGEGTLDLFNRLQLNWTVLGDIQTEVSRSGKPVQGSGLQAKYHQTKTRLTGFSKRLVAGSIAQSKRLTFSAASEKDAKLLVQLEERGGGKYNVIFSVPAGSSSVDFNVPYSDFKAGDDSKDDNGKLDLDQVTQLLILDATGLISGTEADNELWIGNIKVSK